MKKTVRGKKKLAVKRTSADLTSRRSTPFPIVGIGASAGGLEAARALLGQLPLDTEMAFVLVQHLDPQYDSALPELLTRATSMPVHKATNRLRVEPNHVYVITPDTNLRIAEGRLTVQPRPQIGHAQRTIDVFFESLAQDQRERAIGVILSGTASDGTLGLEAIKAEGGVTFAQDATAKYDSMPRSAIAAGCVDFVMSPKDIATELGRIAKHPYILMSPDGLVPPQQERDSQEALGQHAVPRAGAGNDFRDILLMLRDHSKVDFSLYKSTTIRRRINRRVILNKLATLGDYAQCLRGNAKELDALYADVLISVTSFFRNPEAFDLLKQKIFPQLFQQRGDDPLRVWVLGCSSGQEAYSIAMTFMESADHVTRARKLQIFASDINETLLDKARRGLYSEAQVSDVTPARLRRFFVKEDGGYRVTKVLREMVLFARQNLFTDPPFSRLDLISCRNVLIYVDLSLQRTAFPLFHYALKPHGYLLLGASESIGSLTHLFEPVDRKQKVFSKKAMRGSKVPLPPMKNAVPAPSFPILQPVRSLEEWKGQDDGVRRELNILREADRVLLTHFAPPSVLIDADLQIIQFRGQTSEYLQPPKGKANFDILKMAREELLLPLRAVIQKAKKDNATARKKHVRVEQNGMTRTVNVEVIPLKHMQEPCFLVVFTNADHGARTADAAFRQPVMRLRRQSKREKTGRTGELETELSETHDYLQSIQEQHEAANEELQASNEEVQSSNEELQSINEELQTSKEELESANEELTTFNEEMDQRNAELSRLNGDLINLQSSTHLAILLLGRDLAIRRFSAQAARQFNLLVTDIGRSITGVRHNLRQGKTGEAAASLDLEQVITDVITAVCTYEAEVQDQHDHWFSLRVKPYWTSDNRVDGAVLVLVDIDDLKRSEQAVIQARDSAEKTIETLPIPLLVLDKGLRVERANQAFYRTFLVEPAETLGRFIYDLGNRQWDIVRLRQLLGEILPHETFIENFEVEHPFEQLGLRTMLLNAMRHLDSVQKSERILLTIMDITERKRAEDALRESEMRFQILADSAPVLIWMNGSMGAEFVNRAYLEFLGVSGQIDVKKYDWAQYVHPDDRDGYVSTYVKTVEQRGMFDARFRFRRHDGEYRWMRSIAGPRLSLNGELLGYVGATFDISETKEAESQLEHKVEARTRELVHSQDRLRTLTTELNLAEQRERTRVANDLHDYLAQQLVFCRLMLAQAKKTGLTSKAEAFVKETEETLDKALTYCRTLMAELNPPVLQEKGLPAGLIWLVEHMKRQELAAAVEIQEPFDVPLPDDCAVLLFQSVRELLVNVAKHCAVKEATVRMTVEEGMLQIVVRDENGFDLVAASASDISPLSSRFGLFSIRERMKALGGRFDIQSAPGQGTTVMLILPLAARGQQSRQATVESGQMVMPTEPSLPVTRPTLSTNLPLQKNMIRVLLVDDHTLLREGLRSIVSAYPHLEVVGEAGDGMQAVALAQQLHPDVIVMDIHMPNMDGIDATRRIKADWPDIVIIGLSVQQSAETEQKMKAAGAVTYLTKESAADALCHAIEEAVSYKKGESD